MELDAGEALFLSSKHRLAGFNHGNALSWKYEFTPIHRLGTPVFPIGLASFNYFTEALLALSML